MYDSISWHSEHERTLCIYVKIGNYIKIKTGKLGNIMSDLLYELNIGFDCLKITVVLSDISVLHMIKVP